MTLSRDQERALDRLVTFVEDRWPSKQYMTVMGLAGSGKSHLLAHLTSLYPQIKLCAFTGKACSVLRKRVQVPVQTLHSILYDFRGLIDDEIDSSRKQPVFTTKDDYLGDRIIGVDESSMIGTRLAHDLLDTGAKIIAMGDPGQLPPVKDTAYFSDPDVTLTEIHRQALDSAVIRQAHNVRNHGRYEADGADFRVISKAESEDLLAADAILVWRNRSRRRVNIRKRELLGIDGPLRLGEPIMALRNDHQLSIYNGCVYSVIEYADNQLKIDSDGKLIEIELATVEDFDKEFDTRRYNENWLPFAPAYAATVHKAQGDQFESVLIFDEAERDWRAFMYTGITRAVSKCTIVRWRS